ncbi:hypothetical protein QOT17_022743 [Balamuthia mandrillaris]
MEGWCCTHENCTHTGKTGQRVQYASQYASWRHERTRHYHNCGQSCAACERWDGKTPGKAPPSLELAKAKSVYNARQYIVYIGEESREELEKELKNAVKGIEYLINGGTIKAHGIDYALEPVLVCDMAALIKVLGLYTCYHPKSQWKCPWCLVDMDNIADFTREMWPFRDKTQMWTKGEEAAKLKSNSAKKRFAATNFGIQDKPLLRILFNHVIPCQLHCFMGVMRKLVEQLAEYTHGKKKLGKEVEKCFVAAKITLPKRNDKMKTLEQRVAKARFGRPDYIRILENQALFLKAVEKRARRRKSQERAANIKQLWDRFALLASLASQPKVTITENEWLELAREFGTKFTQAFGDEEVTPYIHVFIYHLGFFLEKYGSVERFANYATESRHFQNKHIPTNGHSIQGSDKKKLLLSTTGVFLPPRTVSRRRNAA